MPALAGILMGALLGVAIGGRLEHLQNVRLRFAGLIIVLFVLQAFARGRLLSIAHYDFAFLVWSIIGVTTAAFLSANLRFRGVWLIAAGLVANVLVVLLNGGMPVSPYGVSDPQPFANPFYHWLYGNVLLGWMGDILPAPGRYMLSLGDVLVVCGAAVFVANAMLATDPRGDHGF